MPPVKKTKMISTIEILMDFYNEWYNLNPPKEEHSIKVV